MAFELRVKFSGLSVYLVDPSRDRVAVLMPDAREIQGVDLTHVDGDIGVPHVGYVRFDLANVAGVSGIPASANSADPTHQVVRRFHREELDFGLSAAGVIAGIDPVAAAGIADSNDELLLPKFERFADTLQVIPGLFTQRPPRALLMRTVLRGGEIESNNPGEQFKIDTVLNAAGGKYLRQFTNSITWVRTVDQNDLTLTFKPFSGAKRTRVRLVPTKKRGGVIELKIANLCSDNPLEWEEFGLPENTSRTDEDFKWLYRLFQPKSKGFTSALKKRKLPVPVAQAAAPAGDLILCYGGRTDGPVS